MNRTTVVLVSIAALLGGAYVYFFSDWFTSQRIQIIPQIRPVRSARGNPGVYPVSFTLDGKYRLTSVKVVEANAYKTNKFTAPVWHLISQSNSVPIPGFIYGQPIRGMKPSITNATPRRLQANMAYRLIVEAGKAKGEQDFKTQGIAEPGKK